VLDGAEQTRVYWEAVGPADPEKFRWQGGASATVTPGWVLEPGAQLAELVATRRSSPAALTVVVTSAGRPPEGWIAPTCGVVAGGPEWQRAWPPARAL